MNLASRVAAPACLLAALAVSGCATTGTTGTTTDTLTFAEVLTDAQLAAQTLCAITPTAESIATILIAANGDAAAQASNTEAQQAAAIFCTSVTKTSARRKAIHAVPGKVVDYGTVTINGKVITLQGTPK